MIKIKQKNRVLSTFLPNITCVQLFSYYTNNVGITRVPVAPLGESDPRPNSWPADKCISLHMLYIWKVFLDLPFTINYVLHYSPLIVLC